MRGTTSYAAIRSTDFLNIKIPLPPLEVQNEIVEKIERQKQIIEGAERIIDGFGIYFPSNEWEHYVELGNKEYFEIAGGGTPSKSKISN